MCIYPSSIAAAWADIMIRSSIKKIPSHPLLSPCHLSAFPSRPPPQWYCSCTENMLVSESVSSLRQWQPMFWVAQQIWVSLSQHDRCQFRKRRVTCPAGPLRFYNDCLVIWKDTEKFTACDLLCWKDIFIEEGFHCAVFCESRRVFMKWINVKSLMEKQLAFCGFVFHFE